MRILALSLLALGCTAPKAPPKKTAPASKAPATLPKIELPRCALAPCHGLDVKCSADAPEMCTEIYKHGDFCRAFAKCAVVDGQCQDAFEPKFAECKACMEGCTGQMSCDAECRAKFGMQ